MRKNWHVTGEVREHFTEEMTFCDRIVALSAAQKRSKRHSLHDEKTCERTWPTENKAGCFIHLEYRVMLRVQWWQLVMETEVVKGLCPVKEHPVGRGWCERTLGHLRIG